MLVNSVKLSLNLHSITQKSRAKMKIVKKSRKSPITKREQSSKKGSLVGPVPYLSRVRLLSRVTQRRCTVGSPKAGDEDVSSTVRSFRFGRIRAFVLPLSQRLQ